MTGGSRPGPEGRRLRMPAEWEPHRATWISWPHHEPDWPGKIGPIPWVYAEIARVIADHEQVDILCHNEAVMESARSALDAHAVRRDRCALHIVPTDRVWLRDSAPTGVVDDDGRVALVNWAFNAWAKYPNWQQDADIGIAIARLTGLPRYEPRRQDTGERVVLEGGGIEVNGQGLMLVTEEWLLSDVQIRNPGLGRTEYERIFAEWLGVRRTIWLGDGCVGDDTHGHIDDIARFLAPGVIALAFEEDPADENHRRSVDNLRRLEHAGAKEGTLKVVKLPYPRAVEMDGTRLPASYANFYIANGLVLLPTYDPERDEEAGATLRRLFPGRDVVGIDCTDLVWGLGAFHCVTQQWPATDRKA
jgi:agmatine deiminase